MSRIGKKPITLSENVTVDITNNIVTVKGPKGELQRGIHPLIHVQLQDNILTFKPTQETAKVRALWGLSRALVANMVQGVKDGFSKQLEFEGVGYKVTAEGSSVLTMQLGFSHPVHFSAPEGVTLSVVKNTIGVAGIDKELVGDVAARIRALKPPEPYKGKGIRYKGEVVRRKAGKKAVSSGA